MAIFQVNLGQPVTHLIFLTRAFGTKMQGLEALGFTFLGRLPKVDLIILEGRKMSVRTSVRPSVRPQKVSSISMKFGIQVEVDE